MGKLIIHNERITDPVKFASVCPFSAMEVGTDGKITVNAGCKMCRICVKNSKNGEAEFVEEAVVGIDKSLWRGICVFCDHIEGEIHPVTYELIGKARELADKIGQKVYVLFIGDGIEEAAQELLYYPVDDVFVYDSPALRDFRTEPYAAVFEDFINRNKPSSILIGATTVGRQLAPRVAARMRTGLTADCTILDVEPNTDLSQIRPAFGGNIMAHIFTPNTRPQMATVRYKIMEAAKRLESGQGSIHMCRVSPEWLKSGIEILSVTKKPKVTSIEQAEIIVVAGRGVRSASDLGMINKLADAVGGELAGTRPMIEAGIIEARRQIGLSGRTVRPKLIITCGVSGAIQFVAGMNGSEHIISINNDAEAPIFKTANVGIVGDIYEIVPKLTDEIIRRRKVK